MPNGLNSVTLHGLVRFDPEIVTLPRNSQKIARFSLITLEEWSRDGEHWDGWEQHKVVVYDDRYVDLAEKYVRRGSKLLINGSLKTRRYTDRRSVERSVTEVILSPPRCFLELTNSQAERELWAARLEAREAEMSQLRTARFRDSGEEE